MRKSHKQKRQRRPDFNLAQSSVIQIGIQNSPLLADHAYSFIDELQDLVKDDSQSHLNIPNSQNIISRHRKFSQPSSFQELNNQTQLAFEQQDQKPYQFSRLKSKISQISNFKNSNMFQKRKNIQKDHIGAAADNLPVKFTLEKEPDRGKIKIKQRYRKSSVIRNKQIIYKTLLDKCGRCKQRKSEVFRGFLVCKNRKCRLEQVYHQYQTFPLTAILYELQNPSSTVAELEYLLLKINEELYKLEQWKSLLLKLSYDVCSIKQTKNQYESLSKNQLEKCLKPLGFCKLGKVIEDSQAEIIREKFQNIDFSHMYDVLKKWKEIEKEKYRRCPSISELLLKYQPFCLSDLQEITANEVSNLNDNFFSSAAVIKSSQPLSYSFFGCIKKIKLDIDGKISLKRENFLYIQNLRQLSLKFDSRKTDRQLKELFSMLPRADSLVVDFDFKLNSHISSQNFPIISKCWALAEKQISIRLLNANPQTLDDLFLACRTYSPKLSIKVSVKLNNFISNEANCQKLKRKDWGTSLILQLLKNATKSLIMLEINIPAVIEKDTILQFLAAERYSRLLKFRIQTEQQIEKKLPFSHLEEQKKIRNSNKYDPKPVQKFNVTSNQIIPLGTNESKFQIEYVLKRRSFLTAQFILKKRFTSHWMNRSKTITNSILAVLF